MSYQNFRKSHPEWPKKMNDLIGRKVKLLREHSNRGGDIFEKGETMDVSYVTHGNINLKRLKKSNGTYDGIRGVRCRDVELLPPEKPKEKLELARKSGGKKFDSFTWEDGTKHTIRFHKDAEGDEGDLKFSVGVSGTEIIQDNDIEKLKKRALEFLSKHASLVFEPIILIDHDRDPFYHRKEHEVSLRYERCFMSQKVDGENIFRRFQTVGDIPEEEGAKWSDVLDGKEGNETTMYIDDKLLLPYTKERWKALRTISKMIVALNGRIGELVMDKDKVDLFLSSILERGTKALLPSNEKSKS